MTKVGRIVDGKIMLCLPQYAQSCMAPYMRSVVRLVAAMEAGGYPYELQFGADSAVHRVRYLMTEAFMRSDCDWLMWIDSDIEFEVAQVEKLVEVIRAGADVAVGCYRLKKDGSDFAAHTDGALMKLDDMKGGVIEVDYAGTGFMLIPRATFEKIRGELPLIETDLYGEMPRWWSFDVVDGVELPEDYMFCERVRKAGGRVMMDTSVRVTHWGLKGY